MLFNLLSDPQAKNNLLADEFVSVLSEKKLPSLNSALAHLKTALDNFNFFISRHRDKFREMPGGL